MSRDRELRERLVEYLEDCHVLTDPTIVAAVRRVPRHLFVPDVTIDDAYADRALAIKERGGLVISSISQPAMIVQMLQLLGVRPGQRVLEVGTGSGYNAALLAELVGPEGHVLTVDIEEDLIERARAVFSLLSMQRVEAAQASVLDSISAPFDRIIVTARADDIDDLWWKLLAPEGRIVVPLDIGYGGERAIGFVRDGDYLRSVGSYACAFIEMRSNLDATESEYFFRNSVTRNASPPSPREPLSIVAVRRRDATPELLATVDAIVARPHTLFGISR